MPETKPSAPAPTEGDWSRLLGSCEKLVAAAELLDDLGGLRALASSWPASRREKARAVLAEAHEALAHQFDQLGHTRQPSPPRPSPRRPVESAPRRGGPLAGRTRAAV